MTNSSQNQEYNNLRWGTMMPISLMIGSNFVQLRARGSYSFIIQDAERLKKQVSDPDALLSYTRSQVTIAITNVVGELSQQVSSVAQLTKVTDQTLSLLKSQLETKFAELGLQLKSITIEAIENLP